MTPRQFGQCGGRPDTDGREGGGHSSGNGEEAGHSSGNGEEAGHSSGNGEEAGHSSGNGEEAGHSHAVGRDYARTPLVVTWEVTRACALTCDHCRADACPDRHPDELTTAEGKALLDRVAGFGSPSPILVVSGGDPLERPDLFELLAYGDDIGLPTAVTPAPTASLTREVVEQFAEVGVRRIALSLDGATAERHDGFRGEAGSFETIRAAAEHAADVGLGLQINTTVTGSTVEDLPAIADLVADLGAVMWEVFFLVPVGRGAALEQLSPARAERVLEWLYRTSREAPYRVITVEAPHYRRVARRVARDAGRDEPPVGSTGDGNGFVFVSHSGEVYPSGFLPVGVGSVREHDLVDLYRESTLLQLLRDPDRFRGPCGECRHRGVCGGSRARAFASTGDPLASDPLCLRVSGSESEAD